MVLREGRDLLCRELRHVAFSQEQRVGIVLRHVAAQQHLHRCGLVLVGSLAARPTLGLEVGNDAFQPSSLRTDMPEPQVLGSP